MAGASALGQYVQRAKANQVQNNLRANTLKVTKGTPTKAPPKKKGFLASKLRGIKDKIDTVGIAGVSKVHAVGVGGAQALRGLKNIGSDAIEFAKKNPAKTALGLALLPLAPMAYGASYGVRNIGNTAKAAGTALVLGPEAGFDEAKKMQTTQMKTDVANIGKYIMKRGRK